MEAQNLDIECGEEKEEGEEEEDEQEKLLYQQRKNAEVDQCARVRSRNYSYGRARKSESFHYNRGDWRREVDWHRNRRTSIEWRARREPESRWEEGDTKQNKLPDDRQSRSTTQSEGSSTHGDNRQVFSEGAPMDRRETFKRAARATETSRASNDANRQNVTKFINSERLKRKLIPKKNKSSVEIQKHPDSMDSEEESDQVSDTIEKPPNYIIPKKKKQRLSIPPRPINTRQIKSLFDKTITRRPTLEVKSAPRRPELKRKDSRRRNSCEPHRSPLCLEIKNTDDMNIAEFNPEDLLLPDLASEDEMSLKSSDKENDVLESFGLGTCSETVDTNETLPPVVIAAHKATMDVLDPTVELPDKDDENLFEVNDGKEPVSSSAITHDVNVHLENNSPFIWGVNGIVDSNSDVFMSKASEDMQDGLAGVTNSNSTQHYIFPQTLHESSLRFVNQCPQNNEKSNNNDNSNTLQQGDPSNEGEINLCSVEPMPPARDTNNVIEDLKLDTTGIKMQSELAPVKELRRKHTLDNKSANQKRRKIPRKSQSAGRVLITGSNKIVRTRTKCDQSRKRTRFLPMSQELEVQSSESEDQPLIACCKTHNRPTGTNSPDRQTEKVKIALDDSEDDSILLKKCEVASVKIKEEGEATKEDIVQELEAELLADKEQSRKLEKKRTEELAKQIEEQLVQARAILEAELQAEKQKVQSDAGSKSHRGVKRLRIEKKTPDFCHETNNDCPKLDCLKASEEASGKASIKPRNESITTVKSKIDSSKSRQKPLNETTIECDSEDEVLMPVTARMVVKKRRKITNTSDDENTNPSNRSRKGDKSSRLSEVSQKQPLREELSITEEEKLEAPSNQIGMPMPEVYEQHRQISEDVTGLTRLCVSTDKPVLLGWSEGDIVEASREDSHDCLVVCGEPLTAVKTELLGRFAVHQIFEDWEDNPKGDDCVEGDGEQIYSENTNPHNSTIEELLQRQAELLAVLQDQQDNYATFAEYESSSSSDTPEAAEFRCLILDNDGFEICDLEEDADMLFDSHSHITVASLEAMILRREEFSEFAISLRGSPLISEGEGDIETVEMEVMRDCLPVVL